MDPGRLLQYFEEISEAPDAIARLRGFVLDLAVRGALVDQRLHDEPAFEVIRRIRVEKGRLVKDGRIKKQDPQAPVDDGELGYRLPENWASTRIGDLLTVIRGASPRPKGDPKYFSPERTAYHWIKISDIRKYSKDRVLYNTDEFLTEAGMEKSVLLPRGTLVVTNSATIGVPVFLGFDGGCIHDGYLAFPYFPQAELSREFFFILFQTLRSYAAKKARGMAQLNLNTDLVRQFPLGLPPRAEQQRIVAKVDELMALCDDLEAAQAKRERRRDRLVAATLHGLNNGDAALVSGTRPSFEDSARFYFNHVPRLATRPEHIHQLRQAILNLAVRGRLVPQDPNDEPASTLLGRIRSEKSRLASAGSWKREKDAGFLCDSAPVFKVPESWEWTTYRELALEFRYGTSKKCNYEKKGQPVLRIPNVSGGKITTQDLKFTTLTESEIEHLSLSVGDILMIRSNGSLNLVGRPALVEDRAKGFCYAGYLVRVRFVPDTVSSRYLVAVLNSELVREQIEVPIRTTVGLKNVNSTEFGDLRIALPPLAEQHRIVAKTDELLALCDELETRLTTTAITREKLLEATLCEAINENSSERGYRTVSGTHLRTRG